MDFGIITNVSFSPFAQNRRDPTLPPIEPTSPNMLDKLRAQKQKLLDPDVASEPSFKEEMSAMCPSLTYQERVIGFLTCLILGFLLSLGSTFRLARLMGGHPGPFAIAFTIGNILSLASSMFFVGPCKQVQTMCHKKRRISALLYLIFMTTTLILCFSTSIRHRMPLIVLSVICQFLALIWYTLSFVPYGRHIVLGCCKRMCGMTTDDEM